VVVVRGEPALHNQTRPRALAPDRALTVTATSQAQLGVSSEDLTAGGVVWSEVDQSTRTSWTWPVANR